MIAFVPGYFGWLGNQMFQYAATKVTSLKAGVDCYFPENTPNLHEIFNLNASVLATTSNLPVYKEPSFTYSPIPDFKEGYLYGYFQSEKYFLKYKDIIRKEFTLKNPTIFEPINEISLHVRRGDYIKFPDHHPLCTIEYYNTCLGKLPNLPVTITSDDIDWCKQNFIGNRFKFCNGNFIEDFEYMMHCRYHIIANSSFSWWGAWLAKSEKVFAPKIWFGNKAPGSPKDIYCKDWIIV